MLDAAVDPTTQTILDAIKAIEDGKSEADSFGLFYLARRLQDAAKVQQDREWGQR